MISDLTPDEVAQRLDGDHPPLLLDVREPWEREIAAIPGSAHIPMAQVPSRLDEIPRNRDVVVVCHHGARSAQVATWLQGQGFDRIYNLDGGIDEWSAAVDPSIPAY